MSGTVATDTSGPQIRVIVPTIGAFDASGSATFKYLQQETVTIANIDREFDTPLSEDETKKILEAFTVAGKGPSAGAGQFNVTLTDALGLEQVLVTAIGSATDTDGNTADVALGNDITGSLVSQIQSDGLINTVEDAALSAITLALDASGGAIDLAGQLDVSACERIYLQIPATTLSLYMDASENQTTSALPLAVGDKLTFVFDIWVSTVAVTAQQVVITGDISGGTINGNTDINSGIVTGEYTSTITASSLPTKRYAFNLTMTQTGKNPGEALTILKA